MTHVPPSDNREPEILMLLRFAHTRLSFAIQTASGARDLEIYDLTPLLTVEPCAFGTEGSARESEYRTAMSLALGSRDTELAAQVSTNLAHSALKAGDFEGAETAADEAVETASKLRDSHSKAYDLLSAGRTLNELFAAAPDHDDTLRLRALKTFQKAAITSEAIGDKRGLSFALGYRGELYEAEKNMTRRSRLPAKPYCWHSHLILPICSLKATIVRRAGDVVPAGANVEKRGDR